MLVASPTYWNQVHRHMLNQARVFMLWVMDRDCLQGRGAVQGIGNCDPCCQRGVARGVTRVARVHRDYTPGLLQSFLICDIISFGKVSVRDFSFGRIKFFWRFFFLI